MKQPAKNPAPKVPALSKTLPNRETLLASILSQPSAPFRERHVIALLTRELSSAKVPHFIDPVGNIVVGVKNKAEYLKLTRQKTQDPLRVFIAHMDHPGFHGVEWRGDGKLAFLWHGGSPTADLVGAKVWLATSQGLLGYGKMTEAKLIPSGRAIESGVVTLDPALARETEGRNAGKTIGPKEIYGGFAFREPVWKEGCTIYTKAADDLVGCYAVTTLAIDLWKKKSKAARPFIGLLTRAEEVGYVGAIGHFELDWLKGAKRPIMGVSLETSRQLPQAEIGKGPIVRLGDKTTVFDAGYLRVFSDMALKRMEGRHQRRVMDGGTCEATAATAYGIPCIAISVPLGNYHNQNFEGGPDARAALGPAPEFVHLDDVQGLLELCQGVMDPKIRWEDPWATRLQSYKKLYRDYRALMKSGP